MLKIKRDINQQDLKIVTLHFDKSEYFSLTWSCGSRQRDATSSERKLILNNFAVETSLSILPSDLSSFRRPRGL